MVVPKEYPGVFRSEETKKVVVEHEGKEYSITLKELSWSEMNKVLSKCSSFSADRKASFDLDAYYREALIAMVVDSPWGKLTHQILTRVTPAFGSKLEALVPMPGGGGAEGPLGLGQK